MTGDSDRYPSGVYLIDAAQRKLSLRRGTFPAEFIIAVLDGTVAATRAGFFQEIARVLTFPDYFGRNWDAVYDCLTDLSWLPAAGYALVLDGFDQFAMDAPEQWDIGLKVLRQACAFWQALSRPMVALLYGRSKLAPGVPPLPANFLLSRRDT